MSTEISMGTVKKYVSLIEEKGNISYRLKQAMEMPSFIKWVHIFCNNPTKELTDEEFEDLKSEAELYERIYVNTFIEEAKEIAQTIRSIEDTEITPFLIYKIVLELKKEIKTGTQAAISYYNDEAAADAWFSSPHFP